MEQNSFLFLQAAQIGMSHRDMLRWVVKSACRRNQIPFAPTPEGAISQSRPKTEVNVLFGGQTSERQVSVMSGTNVWLKLRKSDRFNPKPYLLDPKLNVWRLPYSMTLNHTVEEIAAMAEAAPQSEQRLHRLKTRVLDKLSPGEGEVTEPLFLPQKMSLDEFID